MKTVLREGSIYLSVLQNVTLGRPSMQLMGNWNYSNPSNSHCSRMLIWKNGHWLLFLGESSPPRELMAYCQHDKMNWSFMRLLGCHCFRRRLKHVTSFFLHIKWACGHMKRNVLYLQTVCKCQTLRFNHSQTTENNITASWFTVHSIPPRGPLTAFQRVQVILSWDYRE